ncbi:E3 ubiquitin-protein ligase RBBP6-like [Macrobrachium rosenbergii]|uniref:E3 ubiquitin-protein ligase RBBP6-like n=1 Tax=Macrobrachium rosenbergii TaxID=79674 RepID=UPI0034D6B106
MNALEAGDSSPFQSQMENQENSTSTKAETVKCMYTMKLIVMKVEFRYKNGSLVPGCDPANQANASPPYVEIDDQYNRTIRFCSVTTQNYTIYTFGDLAKGILVTNGVTDLVPDIQIVQERLPYCCGGTFYVSYQDNLATTDHYATSPDYPLNYKPNMRCPYIFRCIPTPPAQNCSIQIDFIDFRLDTSNAQAGASQNNRHLRVASTGLAPPNQGFNKCGKKDYVRVAKCGSITGYESQLYCSGREPFNSWTAENEILVYFKSDGKQEDSGFVISYSALDRNYGIYTPAEINSTCRCGQAIPSRVRAESEKLNQSGSKEKGSKKKKAAKQRALKSKRSASGSKDSHINESIMNKGDLPLKGVKEMKHKERKKKTQAIQTEKAKNKVKRKKFKKSKKKSKKKKNTAAKKGHKTGKAKSITAPKGNQPKSKITKLNRKGARRPEKKGYKRNKLSKSESLKSKKAKIRPGESRIYKGKKIKDPKESSFIVTVLQRVLNKKNKKPKNKNRMKRQSGNGKKKKNTYKIARQCVGVAVNEYFILTSTACCTYCRYAWEKKFKKKQTTTISGMLSKTKSGAAIQMKKSSVRKKSNKNKKQRQNVFKGQNKNKKGNVFNKSQKGKGNKKKTLKKKNTDVGKIKNEGNKKTPRKKNKKRYSITSKKQQKGGKTQKTNLKLKEKSKKQFPKSKREKAKSVKKGVRQNDNKKKKKKKKKNKKKKKGGFRAPKKNDIYVMPGQFKIKPNKIQKYKIMKPKRLYLPEECVLRMNDKKTDDGRKLYRAQCPVIIEVKKPMVIGENAVTPICLPAFDTIDIGNSVGASIGYGKKNKNAKKMVVTPKILTGIQQKSPSECQTSLKRILPEDMFCTHVPTTRGSNCIGDEGSPFILYTPTSAGYGEHITVGALLAGSGCTKAKKKKPKAKVVSRSRRSPDGKTQNKRKQKSGKRSNNLPRKKSLPRINKSGKAKHKIAKQKVVKSQSQKKQVKSKSGTKVTKIDRLNDIDRVIEINYKTGSAIVRQTTGTGKKKKKNKKVIKQPKKYNKLYNNGKGIDTWVSITRYMTWIVKIVFSGDDRLLCQRPLDLNSAIEVKNRTLQSNACSVPTTEPQGGFTFTPTST